MADVDDTGRSSRTWRRCYNSQSSSSDNADVDDSRLLERIDRQLDSTSSVELPRRASLEDELEHEHGNASGSGSSKTSKYTKSYKTADGTKVNISVMRHSSSDHQEEKSNANGGMLRLDLSRMGSLTNDFCESPRSQTASSGGSTSPPLLVATGAAAVAAGGAPHNFKAMLSKYASRVQQFAATLRTASVCECAYAMDEIHRLVRQAWNMPGVGRDLAYALCDVLRTSGALDTLIAHCSDPSSELRFQSARTLEQCLSTNNRDYVVETGLDGVVKVACIKGEPAMARVGTGILENLFKHSEETCTKVVRLGGLESILTQSRSNDTPTMRHCAAAFANLALYGGAENHQLMIKQNVPEWLFPLAFSKDDSTRYYACLAICSLGSNKEIEAAVKKSGTLELVEPFLTSHDPQEFARSDDAHTHGRSKDWLQLLVPSLTSSRVEARSLAAFHFAMEASIKKRQNRLEDFYEIGAIDALKRVASSPNKLASKYAGEALQIIGEEIPHKLSLQVPLWTAIDVLQWVKQIGFELFESEFTSCRVDGDLLLQLDDAMLESDICMSNGILRKRFLRELKTLKINADYSCVDPSGLDSWMLRLQTDLSQYSYSMLHQGVCMDMLPYLNDDHLRDDCGIGNGIHRLRIAGAIRNTLDYNAQLASGATSFVAPPPAMVTSMYPPMALTPYPGTGIPGSYGRLSSPESAAKPLDVFISYRRSSGSQLASLLKVHLQLRGFRVFIDVERLEVGKFDMNLLTSIRSSKNFILVLTTHALDRCLNDENCKDWVHKEVKAALECGCSIIPVHDNFEWPEAEHLPEDMRAVCHFNGIRWIHDYQEACVDKLERFLRGENAMTKSDSMAPMPPMHGAGAPKFPLPPPAIDEQRSDSGGSSGSLVDEASLFRELAGSEVVRGDSAAPTKTNAMPRAPALLLPEPPRSRRVGEREGGT